MKTCALTWTLLVTFGLLAGCTKEASSSADAGRDGGLDAGRDGQVRDSGTSLDAAVDASMATDGASDGAMDAATPCGSCEDGIGCTIDRCVDGGCVHEAVDESCDDGNRCTTEVCDPDEGCRYTALEYVLCPGTGGTCFAGVCSSTDCAFKDRNSPCYEHTWCNSDGGAAYDVPLPNGTPCQPDPAVFDAGPGTCVDGVCTPS